MNEEAYTGIVIGGIIAFLVAISIGWGIYKYEFDHQVMIRSHQYQEANEDARLRYEEKITDVNIRLSEEKDPKVRRALKAKKKALESRKAKVEK